MFTYLIYVILLTCVTVTNAKTSVCYQCSRRCYTNVTIECPSNCCYLLTVFENERGWWNIRGCYKSNANCTNFCKVIFEGGAVYCNSCKGDYCNRDILQEPFYCYECDERNRVDTNSNSVACPAVDCCYMAHVQVGREFRTVRDCTQTCQKVRRQFLLEYPKEIFGGCVSCRRGDASKCKQIQIKLRCYRCDNCGVDTRNNTLIVCGSNKCFTASLYEVSHAIDLKAGTNEEFVWSTITSNSRDPDCADCVKLRSDKKIRDIEALKRERFLSRTLLSIDIDEEHIDDQVDVLDNEDSIKSSSVTDINTNSTNYLDEAYKLVDLVAQNTSNGSNQHNTKAMEPDVFLIGSSKESKTIPTSRAVNDEQEINYKLLNSGLKNISNKNKDSNENSADLNHHVSPKIVVATPLIQNTSLDEIEVLKNSQKQETETIKAARIENTSLYKLEVLESSDILEAEVVQALNDRQDRRIESTTLMLIDDESAIPMFSNGTLKIEAVTLRIANMSVVGGEVIENADKHKTEVNKGVNYGLEGKIESTPVILSNVEGSTTVPSNTATSYRRVNTSVEETVVSEIFHRLESEVTKSSNYSKSRIIENTTMVSVDIESTINVSSNVASKIEAASVRIRNTSIDGAELIENLDTLEVVATKDANYSHERVTKYTNLISSGIEGTNTVSFNEALKRETVYFRIANRSLGEPKTVEGYNILEMEVTKASNYSLERGNDFRSLTSTSVEGTFNISSNGASKTAKINKINHHKTISKRTEPSFLEQLEQPLESAIPSNAFIECYDCAACSSTTKTTPTTQCATNCCYTAVWMVNNVLNNARQCADNDEITCKHYCNEIAELVRSDNNGVLRYCRSCNQNRCNHENTDGVISCYQCEDCETPNVVECAAGCCYTARFKGVDGLMRTSRDCADVQPGRTCRVYCKFLQSDECSVCTTDKCNAIANCYTCEGCDSITSITQKVMCGTNYCYSIRTNSLTVIRGCATKRNYCTMIENVMNCKVCTGDGCNDNLFGGIECYSCSGCDSVETDTAIRVCSKAKCCYTIQDTSNNVERDCATNRKCETYCDVITTNSSIQFCNVCSGNKCNLDLISPLTINCYQCSYCDEITEGTTIIECPESCCFVSQIMFGNATHKSERKCAAITPGWSCEVYCAHTNKSLHATTTLRHCEVCTTDNCNNKSLIIPTMRLKKADPIKSCICYHCFGCYSIKKTTRSMLCESGCCYTAVWTDHGATDVARLCGEAPCKDNCDLINKTVTESDPNGIVHSCSSCLGDRCNKIAVQKPTATVYSQQIRFGSIDCYNCTGCDSIVDGLDVVKCSSRCCYAIYLKSDEMAIVERGCAKVEPGRSCGRYCYRRNTAGDMCEVCHENRCNTKEFAAGSSFISCYDCLECNVRPTVLKRCVSKCCYAAIWTENSLTISGRFCASLDGVRCGGFCKHVETVVAGKMHYCKECEGHRCNNQTLKRVQTRDFLTYIECYTCSNCSKAEQKSLAKCKSNCCYDEIFYDNTTVVFERGCAKLSPGKPCQRYCSATEVDYLKSHPARVVKHCKVCMEDRCNTNVIDVPNMNADVSCYDCFDCNAQPTNDTKVIPCPSKCCYSAVWTSRNVSLSGRFCANLGGAACGDYCKSLEKGADESIHYCAKCVTNRCNNEVMSQRKGLVNQIECYNCTNCNSVDKSTATVQCKSNCCYSGVFLADNGLNISERICASLRPGKPCLSYCSVTEEEYLILHPRGIMKHCETCTGDRCNKHIPRLVIKCYHCYDCYSKPNNAIKQEPCETNCCYSAAWSENNNTISGRLCAIKTDLHNKLCVDVCSEFRGLTSIDLHECDSCIDDLCNNKPIRKQHKQEIVSCYDCKDCSKEPDSKTNTLNCGSNCCYTATNKAKGVERSCAKLRPGKTCQNFCTVTSNDLKDCTTCTKDLCNQSDKTKSAPVIKTELIRCYEYFGCYSKPTGDAKVDKCTTNCCFTAKWLDGNATICTRQCATDIFLNGLKCNELCKSFKGHKDVKFCKECDSDKCNNHVIPLLYTEILKISYLNCYDCKGCDKVEEKKTNTIVCKSDCCYSGTKKSGEIQRSCAKLRPDITCDNFCQVSKSEMSIVKNCHTCTTELCNANTLKTIECYYCLECYRKPTRYSESCPSGCCSSMVWTDGNRTRSGRGCLELDNPTQTCDTFCDDKDHQYCKTCESSKCNNEIIPGRYKDMPNKQFNCYNCEDCNVVEKTTATIKCASDCCYSSLNTAGVMTRSCSKLRPGITCDNFCQVSESEKILGDNCTTCTTDLCNIEKLNIENVITTVHITTTTTAAPTKKSQINCHICMDCYSNPINIQSCESNCCFSAIWRDGNITRNQRRCVLPLESSSCATACKLFEDNEDVEYCRSCTSEKCNNEVLPYSKDLLRSIRCYNCKDCKDVNAKTKIIRSVTLCCYTSLYRNGTIDRGGAKLRPGLTCENFCKLSKVDVNEAKNCKTCRTAHCNKDGLDPDKPVNCYSCYGCFSEPTAATTDAVHCETGCCYSAVWYKEETAIIRRHCASEDVLNKTKCNALCQTWKKELYVPYCNTCTDETCNQELIPNTRKATGETFMCYDCTGCEAADKSTNAIKCMSECCYTGFNSNGDFVRSCAKIRPGMPCENFCIEAKYDLSVVRDCNVCTKDRCNMESFEKPKPIPVAPKDFQCYNCYGCHSPPNRYTPTINCATQCCYTAVWADGDSTITGRLCAPPEKLTLINKNCSELCDQFKDVQFCYWCHEDKCNKQKMPYPNDTVKKQISCIDCKGCKQPSKNTIKCGTGCCYASLNKKKNITRSCARLRPGLQCDRFCTELIEYEELKDCYACTSDSCNVLGFP